VVADQGFLPAGHCRLECRYNDARRAVVSAELLVSCVRADGTTVGEQSVPIDPRVALALLGFPSTEKLMEIADAAAELEVAS